MRPVFIFCEGPHDVAFLGRLLQCKGAKPYKEPFKNYPKPLAGLIINRFQTRNIEEARFRSSGPMALDCPPVLEAAYILESPQRLLLLYRCVGDKQVEAVRGLLQTLVDLCSDSNAPDNRIPPFGVLFVNDADISPVGDMLNRICTTYATVLKPVLPNLNELRANSILKSDGFSCGCLIFCNHDGTSGTLENILEPIMRKGQIDRHTDADAFVLKHATSNTVAGNAERPSKKLKAVLTAAGQMDFPSCGLSVIIRDSNALNWEYVKDDAKCLECLHILVSV